MSSESVIFHVAAQADVAALNKNGVYRCGTLETEGFIHCCEPGQLPGVVQRYYQGMDKLTLLVINPEDLDSALIMENTLGGSELFPHIYGPINAEAICEQLEFGLNSSKRLGLAL